MHRRQFCVSGAAVAAGIAAGRAIAAATALTGAPPAASPPLYKVIFDTRFAASREFGMAAASAGRMTAAIRGDVTALWSTDLRRQWAAGRVAIAGMTTMPSFFCLQQLAKDHWMRAVVVGEHGPGAGADVSDPKLVSWVIA
jgi:hypothetical protein